MEQKTRDNLIKWLMEQPWWNSIEDELFRILIEKRFDKVESDWDDWRKQLPLTNIYVGKSNVKVRM